MKRINKYNLFNESDIINEMENYILNYDILKEKNSDWLKNILSKSDNLMRVRENFSKEFYDKYKYLKEDIDMGDWDIEEDEFDYLNGDILILIIVSKGKYGYSYGYGNFFTARRVKIIMNDDKVKMESLDEKNKDGISRVYKFDKEILEDMYNDVLDADKYFCLSTYDELEENMKLMLDIATEEMSYTPIKMILIQLDEKILPKLINTYKI